MGRGWGSWGVKRKAVSGKRRAVSVLQGLGEALLAAVAARRERGERQRV